MRFDHVMLYSGASDGTARTIHAFQAQRSKHLPDAHRKPTRERILNGVATAILLGFASVVHSVPVRVDFSVSNATLFDTVTTVSIPDFAASAVFELGGFITSNGTGPFGGRNTNWRGLNLMHFETTTPYEAILQGYSGLAQGETVKSASAFESINPPQSGVPPSKTFIAAHSIQAGRLFTIDIEGQSQLRDIPGIDAGVLTAELEFLDFLEVMETHRFSMTGYRTTNAGFVEFGAVNGQASIVNTSILDVSEPNTLAIMTLAIGGFGYLKFRRLSTYRTKTNCR